MNNGQSFPSPGDLPNSGTELRTPELQADSLPSEPQKRFLYVFYKYVCVLSCFSHIWLFAPPCTVARQTLLSIGFSQQEYWSGLSFPPPGESSWPRDQKHISCVSSISRQIFHHWAIWNWEQYLLKLIVFWKELLTEGSLPILPCTQPHLLWIKPGLWCGWWWFIYLAPWSLQFQFSSPTLKMKLLLHFQWRIEWGNMIRKFFHLCRTLTSPSCWCK